MLSNKALLVTSFLLNSDRGILMKITLPNHGRASNYRKVIFKFGKLVSAKFFFRLRLTSQKLVLL